MDARTFLKEIHLESSEALFARRLSELSASLKSAPWLKGVRQIRRTYNGEMGMELEVRKPLCVLRHGERKVYLSEDLQELRVLGSSPRVHRRWCVARGGCVGSGGGGGA